MFPSLLHKMAQYCMNTAKESSGGRTPRPPSNKTLLDNAEKAKEKYRGVFEIQKSGDKTSS